MLTATITPPAGVPDLARTDPELRLLDYTSALTFYLDKPNRIFDNMVFIDNSQTDLSPLKNVVENLRIEESVEFISFFGLDHPPVYGRGYGEFKMLDYAMANSRIIAGCSATDKIWKVTGRYIVTNIHEFIKRAPHEFEVYCNIRRWPRRWMDLYLFSWTRGGYDTVFHGVHESLREDITGTSPEECMWDVINDSFVKVKIVPRYTMQPYIEGIRGFDNRTYEGGSNLMKFYLRSFTHRFLPKVWI